MNSGRQTYPRDWLAVNGLGTTYGELGQYDRRLAEKRNALRLDPTNAWIYATIVASYIYLNRLAEARVTAEEAQAKNLDSSLLRRFLYGLAFLQRCSRDGAAVGLGCWQAGSGRR